MQTTPPEARLDRLSELCGALDPAACHEARDLIEKLRLAKQQSSERQRALAESQAEAIVNAGVMMSELEEAHAELDRARRVAEAANVAKSRFLANMSHEIRTPMNGVLGMLQLVLESGLEAKQRDRLETAYRSAQSLLTLLNDILEFSKLEAGRLELERTEFSLAELTRDVGALFAPQCETRNITLRCDVEPAIGVRYYGDPHRVRQILSNLAGNAVKFTSAGSVQIELRLIAAGTPRDRIQIDIRDTGIGIPADRLEQLFKPFAQIDASTSRRYGGTGLGLAISAQLAELMGGALQVQSEPGIGSTFSLLLPLERAGSVTLASVPQGGFRAPEVSCETASPTIGIRRGRILLVEDNAINRTLALAMLELYELDVECAQNGHEALDCLSRQPYELVLMDCQMPELDGYDATRAWRLRETQSGAPPVPIIALTANAMHGDRENCLAAGMNDYLAKPFTRDALTQILQRWLPPAAQDPNRAVA